eukprot:XP_001705265.1 Hypothetical protein GL50803_35452 [Giardia lamblia ATCC 50803]
MADLCAFPSLISHYYFSSPSNRQIRTRSSRDLLLHLVCSCLHPYSLCAGVF